MAKPPSHSEQLPKQMCGNCRHSVVEARYRDLFCMRNEKWQVTGNSKYPVTATYIAVDGEEITCMEGDQYNKVWARCVVDYTDICDEWESENDDQTV
jgi:hypothetical protein